MKSREREGRKRTCSRRWETHWPGSTLPCRTRKPWSRGRAASAASGLTPSSMPKSTATRTAWPSWALGHGDVVAAFLYNTPDFVFTMLAAARLWAPSSTHQLPAGGAGAGLLLKDGAARALVFEHEGGEVAARAQALLKAEGGGTGAGIEHWIFADDCPGRPAAGLGHAAPVPPWPGAAAARRPRPMCARAIPASSCTPAAPRAGPRACCIRTAASWRTTPSCTRPCSSRATTWAWPWRRSTTSAESAHQLFARLQAGATQVLLRRFDVTEAWRLIHEERVSFFFAGAHHGHHAAGRPHCLA